MVKTKKAMEDNPGEVLTVLVETEVSMENVSRLAESRGYSVKVEEVSGDLDVDDLNRILMALFHREHLI